jgi:hypothetical protein
MPQFVPSQWVKGKSGESSARMIRKFSRTYTLVLLLNFGREASWDISWSNHEDTRKKLTQRLSLARIQEATWNRLGTLPVEEL